MKKNKQIGRPRKDPNLRRSNRLVVKLDRLTYESFIKKCIHDDIPINKKMTYLIHSYLDEDISE